MSHSTYTNLPLYLFLMLILHNTRYLAASKSCLESPLLSPSLLVSLRMLHLYVSTSLTRLSKPLQSANFFHITQGPFEISQVLSLLTYCLRLPPIWKIHNVFHTTLLSPFKETVIHGPNFLSPPPIMIGSEEEYEVNKIVSHRGLPG